MRFCSGFGLRGEEELFASCLRHRGGVVVAGFSRGAQEALNFAVRAVEKGERVDELILLSPAWFDDRTQAWKEHQCALYGQHPGAYMRAFYAKMGEKRHTLAPFLGSHSEEELRRLLFFVWHRELLEELKEAGVWVEVHLGGRDEIVSAQAAADFFTPSGTVFFCKERGHLLQSRALAGS